MSQGEEAELAIRNYLLFRQDPAQLIDSGRIAELENTSASATDPIEKLKAIAALAKARDVDGRGYEERFVQHARAWAEQNEIPVASFREMGIPDSVLRAAGLGPSARSKSSGSRSGHRRSVSAKEIQAHIMSSVTGKFTLADLSASVGGSPMTVRKAVEDLVRSGGVTRLGPTPGWPGPGRAPIQFAKS